MKLASLEDAYIATLKDLVSTERQIVPALEKMSEAATDEKLKEAFSTHKEETSGQMSKLEELFTGLGKSSRGRKCKGIEGILADGEAFIASKGDEAARDVALICAARRVEHFEITSYRAAAHLAHHLGRDDELKVLQEILQEEQATDTKLAEILSGMINPESAVEYSSSETEAKPRSSQQNERTETMRYDHDDRYDNRGNQGYEGRSRGGQRSSQYQERDEYGQFAGNRGGGGRYEDDSRGGGQRYSSGGGSRGYYDDDNGRGSYEGRSRGGQHSSQMQERDEYGQFSGNRGGYGGGGLYEDDNRGGGQRYSSGGGSRGGYDDNDRGGSRSRGDYTDSAGRHYTEDSWERAQEGRSRGGQHSHTGGRNR